MVPSGAIEAMRLATIDDFDLPQNITGVFMHLKYKITHYFQVKENLINVGISKLPNDWKYVSWVDADITFLNHNWVQDTIEKLKTSDFVQLFQSALFKGPEEEVEFTLKSCMYSNEHRPDDT